MNAAQTVNATFAQGIAVTAPNGGQTWSRNSTSAITWNYRGSPGTGSYSWKVPSNQATGTDYRVRVTSTTATGYTDTSDANFTID